MKNTLKFLILIIIFTPFSLNAATINVKTVDQLQTAVASATPSDIIILKNGIYKDFYLSIKKSGTANNPISIKAVTSGKVNIFDQPIIKNIGEYIAKSYVGDGWVVNFANASAQGGGDYKLIYRYGKAVNSLEMQQFAAFLNKRDDSDSFFSGTDYYQIQQNAQIYKELLNTKPAVSEAAFTWYPETEFCYLRNKSGFFLATKGGFNDESHNHNDMGTFSLYYKNVPMFIDAGVGTYTRQTFSNERYDIWTMQSNYHNLPMINGIAQKDGREYRSDKVVFNAKKSSFSLNLAKAYPNEAAVENWNRSYQLKKQGGLTIQDDFQLKEIKNANQLNYLTWGKPDISVPGSVVVEKDGVSVKLTYDAKQFDAVVETIALTDRRLSRVWDDKIYRLSLNAKKIQKSGKYKITLKAN